MNDIDNITLIRFRGLQNRQIANSYTQLYRLMARPQNPFPKPIVLSSSAKGQHKAIAWRLSDVEDWLERQAKTSEAIGVS